MSSMNNDGDSPVVPLVKRNDVGEQAEVRPCNVETAIQTEVEHPPAPTLFGTLTATLTSWRVLGQALVVIVGMLLLASLYSAHISSSWFAVLEVVAAVSVYVFNWVQTAELRIVESLGYGFVTSVVVFATLLSFSAGSHFAFLMLLAAAAPALLETLSFTGSWLKLRRKT